MDEDEILALFEDAFTKTRTGIQQATRSFSSCSQRVEGYRIPLAPVMPTIREKLADIRDALEKLVKLIAYAFDHYTPVLSLIRESFDWINNVEKPVSNLSAPVVTPRDENLRYWDGAAAAAYQSKADAQQGAVDDVTVKAQFISKWLFTIAQSNVDYMVELASIVAQVAGKITEMAIEGVSIVDILFSISSIASAVGTIVEIGVKNLIGFAHRFMEALGHVRDIASEVGDHTKLPNGHWPQAIAG